MSPEAMHPKYSQPMAKQGRGWHPAQACLKSYFSRTNFPWSLPLACPRFSQTSSVIWGSLPCPAFLFFSLFTVLTLPSQPECSPCLLLLPPALSFTGNTPNPWHIQSCPGVYSRCLLLGRHKLTQIVHRWRDVVWGHCPAGKWDLILNEMWGKESSCIKRQPNCHDFTSGDSGKCLDGEECPCWCDD